jgi:hypothetical protein
MQSPLAAYLPEIAARRAEGHGWMAIAAGLTEAIGIPITPKRVQEYYKYHKGAGPVTPPEPPPTFAVRVAAPAVKPKDVHDYLQLPPAPFAVPIAKAKAPAVLKGLRRTVWYSDTHFPHHDQGALEVVLAVIQALQPEGVVHGGDLLDCYRISAFSKDPNHLHSLQDEIDQARAHLHQVAQLAPHADRWLLEGNQEDRLRRLIWDLPGGASELARLTAFKQAITWPVLLGLDEIGWTFVPADQQTRTPILPKLITKHGTVVRKWSGFTAKGEWERYGKGGVSGHTHRLGAFYHRDHNGSHLWVESGCTCSLSPDYMIDPDWQQGFLVITHTKDGERYTVEDVYIQDGVALFRRSATRRRCGNSSGAGRPAGQSAWRS